MSLNSQELGLLITRFQEADSQHSHGHQMADSGCQSLLTLLGQSSVMGLAPKFLWGSPLEVPFSDGIREKEEGGEIAITMFSLSIQRSTTQE